MEYSISVWTPFFLLLLMQTLIFTGIPVQTLFLQRGNAAQTALSPRSVAGAYTLNHIEGVKMGEPRNSFPPTAPESTENARQPTARSRRRISCHAANTCCTSFAYIDHNCTSFGCLHHCCASFGCFNHCRTDHCCASFGCFDHKLCLSFSSVLASWKCRQRVCIFLSLVSSP